MSSSSPENILLYLPPAQEEAIREVFAELADAGLPQQFQRPHITVTFAKAMDPAVVELAARLLPPLLPATFARVGTVVFGTKSKQTIAWLLEADPALEEAARAISAANPEGRGARWTPHLTMGLRIPRQQVPDYIAALDDAARARRISPSAGRPALDEFTADVAGYWRPKTQEWRVFEF